MACSVVGVGSHEFKQTRAMIGRMVRLVRVSREDVAIIIRLDAGCFDEKLLKFMDEDLNVGFVVGVALFWFKSTGALPQGEQLGYYFWSAELKFTELIQVQFLGEVLSRRAHTGRISQRWRFVSGLRAQPAYSSRTLACGKTFATCAYQYEC